MHHETHRSHRTGWLRAAVLGANDGVISTASIILGVAAAKSSHGDIMLAGVASIVAGALAMAAGEYVSVSSQSDTEQADLAQERKALAEHPEAETQELADIYVARGLKPELAREVALQLMAHDALDAHARDELGFTETAMARPLQAALASAASFAVGAGLPLVAALFAPQSTLIWFVAGVSLTCLAVLGAVAAQVGGANLFKGAARVLFWGALAMASTAGVGALVGAPV